VFYLEFDSPALPKQQEVEMLKKDIFAHFFIGF
jgi:hypothetical protein